MTLAPCPFDAAAFGFPWFRVTDTKGLAQDIAALPPGPWAVDAKVDDPAPLQALGFVPVCTQVVLERPLDDVPVVPSGITLCDRLDMDPALVRRHAGNFTFDRFNSDPHLPAEGILRLYSAWLANSLSGRKRIAHAPGGVATWTPGSGAIDLISVLEPGRGLGRRLVQALAADAAASGVERLTVTTEERNEAALAMYHACGFRPVRRTVVLHLVNLECSP